MQSIAIHCRGIKKSFGEGSAKVEALRGVNLDVFEGEFLLLMGPSGSGKTTLLSIISGILTQDAGICLIDNINLNAMPDAQKTRYRGERIGFVFQSFNLIPTLTSVQNISIPLILNGKDLQYSINKARELLQLVGIPEKASALPPQLSGGQQQRVAIARALIHEPKLIVCDEPTSFLDHASGHQVMQLLRSIINQQGKTLIVVSHDMRIVSFADRIVKLEDGII